MSDRGTRLRTTLILSALALVLVGIAWDRRLDEHVIPKRFGTVEEGKIYRAGMLTPATFRKVIEEHGIRTIIDLGAWEENEPGDRLAQETAQILGVTRYRFNLVGDSTGNPNYYVHALRLMNDPANQPVLVHCGAGTERTGCLVMMHLNVTQGVPFEESYKEARSYGHNPRRNPHFQQTVDRWADDIRHAFEHGGLVEGADPLPVPQPTNSGR